MLNKTTLVSLLYTGMIPVSVACGVKLANGDYPSFLVLLGLDMVLEYLATRMWFQAQQETCSQSKL